MEYKNLINFLGSFGFMLIGFLFARSSYKRLLRETGELKVHFKNWFWKILFTESGFFGLLLIALGSLMFYYSIKTLLS